MQLLCLGVSDMSVGLICLALCSWSWICREAACDEDRHCLRLYQMLMSLGHFLLVLNNAIALFIAFVRAHAVSSMAMSMQYTNESIKSLLIKLVIVSIFGTIFTTVAQFALDRLGRTFWLSQSGSQAFYLFCMVALASFTIIRMKCRTSNFSSGVDDEFQKLVSIVTVVYCVNAAFSIVLCVYFKPTIVTDQEIAETTNPIIIDWYYLYLFANMMNSSLNLFIYMVASNNFRGYFVNFWVDVATAVRWVFDTVCVALQSFFCLDRVLAGRRSPDSIDI